MPPSAGKALIANSGTAPGQGGFLSDRPMPLPLMTLTTCLTCMCALGAERKRGSSMWRTCLAAVLSALQSLRHRTWHRRNRSSHLCIGRTGRWHSERPSTRFALSSQGLAQMRSTSARLQGVSMSADQKGAVRSASGKAAPSGAIQQSYAKDPTQSADQKPPLIGQANPDIVLHSMADASEGSASATEKPAPTGFIILGVELKLKSASG